MKKIVKISSIIFLILSASSCAVLDKAFREKEDRSLDFIDGSTKMDLKKFFEGELEGFAVKQDENDKIIETFTAKINGKWDANKGVVQFNFSHSGGEKDSRTWLITLNSDGSFDGVGHDVVKPMEGKQAGNVAQSFYSLNVGSKANKEEIRFREKIYLVDEKSAILISEFKSEESPKENSGRVIFSIKKKSAN